MKDVEIRDLQPIQGTGHSRPRPNLQQLSDDELLESARHPKNGDHLTVNKRTGTLVDGSGRAHELLRRAANPLSSIQPDMKVPVDESEPDMSMFPDLD